MVFCHIFHFCYSLSKDVLFDHLMSRISDCNHILDKITNLLVHRHRLLYVEACSMASMSQRSIKTVVVNNRNLNTGVQGKIQLCFKCSKKKKIVHHIARTCLAHVQSTDKLYSGNTTKTGNVIQSKNEGVVNESIFWPRYMALFILNNQG